MRITKLWFLLIAAVALALVIAGCTKEGDPIKGNIAPDTRILSYVVSTAAELDTLGEPTTSYAVTVYWAGSDLDGRVISYLYSVGSESGESLNSQENFVLDFANAAAQYVMQVRAKDNNGAVDPSPAQITIQRNFGGVETAIIEGPPHGAEVAPGVEYKVGATSPTGTITHIAYSVNAGAWTQVAANDLGQADVAITGMEDGVNVIAFAGVRDDGVTDDSPATISLMVRSGVYLPILQNTGVIVDGGGWFEGVAASFNWRTEQGHYYGALPAEPYSAVAGLDLAPPTGWDMDPDTPLGDSEWMSDAFIDYQPLAGDHVVYIKVRDTGGGCDTMRIRFAAAAPTLDQGILVVNGVQPGSAGYGAAIEDRLSDGVYWGSYVVDFWDLFGDDDGPGGGTVLPPGIEYKGGGAQVPPGLMAVYSTIVWLGNDYAGDLAFWNLTPIYGYLQAGGNVFLATRNTINFFDDNLTAWLNVAWREANINIVEYEPVFPGLVAMTPFTRSSMTWTDTFSGGGFLDSYDDNEVTLWDGTYSYTKSDLTSTLLFAHRSDAYTGAAVAGYVRGLGAWSHPNFAFSSTTAINEFPTPGTEEAQGNFVLLGSRNYGFDLTATTHNFEFILLNMCGEVQ